MRGGSLYRWSQRGGGLKSQAQELMLEGAKESLRGVDINRLVRQGLDQGIHSIDRQALKTQAEADFKKGVKKGIKRKVRQSLPGRAVKRVRDIFSGS